MDGAQGPEQKKTPLNPEAGACDCATTFWGDFAGGFRATTMPVITKILEQKRRQNRRSVYLDGTFAFGCNVNVVARFRLRPGMTLSVEQLEKIEQGEVRQECFDVAIRYLQTRLHSRVELSRKLMRREYGQAIVEQVLDDLARLGYVDDMKFAKAKTMSAAQHRHHGRRRAYAELLKSGVNQTIAGRAVEEVYETHDSLATARRLASKQAPRLRRLEPIVARRRLVGMLQRRGFSYEDILPVVDEVLGSLQESSE
jgi:regulatory protein